MGKIDELYNTKELVKKILEEYPEARDSDELLYIKVVEHRNPGVLKMSFWAVMIYPKKYSLPATETVRRARQRVQEQFPELCGKETTRKARRENEQAYKAFALGMK